jgi:hypothetical protein
MKYNLVISFWYFVPESGVAFILISVILIAILNGYGATLDHPYIWIFSAEPILFFIFFLLPTSKVM